MIRSNNLPLRVVLTLFTAIVLSACGDSPEKQQHKARSLADDFCANKSAKGLCVITLGPTAQPPVHFETELVNMQRLPDGSLRISNQLDLVMSDARWTLTEASVIFKRSADGQGIDRLSGEARIPFDQIPILDKAKTGGGVMAALGYDQGKNLDQLDAPINADTHYLFFAFKESFSVSFGFDDLGIPVRGGDSANKPFSFTPVPQAKLVMVVDTSDPFFYVSAKGLSPKKKDKEKEESDKKKKSRLNIGGFGFSLHNRIPEAVVTTDFHKKMTGTLLLEGAVPFPPAPVINYNGFYLTGKSGLLQAISGDINLGFPLKWLISFNMALGNATAIADTTHGDAEILLAGRFQPDTSWVPALIPLFPQEDVQLAARLNTGNKTANFIHGQGSFAIAGSAYAPPGLQFKNITSKRGEFRITFDQMEMSGGVDSDLSPFRFGAGTHFKALFAGKSADNLLSIDGNILIGSFDSQGLLAITPEAVTLNASINPSSEWEMAMQAKLHKDDAQGLLLSGSFDAPSYLNDRIAASIKQRAKKSRNDIQQQIETLTGQLSQLTADLPNVRSAVKKAAEAALWQMNTDHADSLVNRELSQQCGKVAVSVCRSAYNSNKEVTKVKRQLKELLTVVKQSDSENTRAALKTALQQVISSNPVEVNLTVKTIKVAYLDKSRKTTLENASRHIEQLKSTGGKQIEAKQQLDEFTNSTLNQVAKQIEDHANAIDVKRIGFNMPAMQSGPVTLSISLSILGQAPASYAVDFDAKQPQHLPGNIAAQITR
jgi:hypothetical protein